MEEPASKRPRTHTDDWVETRLHQTEMHLKKLHELGGVHGRGLITYDELQDALTDLQYALAAVLNDPEAAKQEATASPVFWAIMLAQNVAAQRPGGWEVDSADAVADWDALRMHEWLTEYKSEKHTIAERSGTGTSIGRAKGAGRGSGLSQLSGRALRETGGDEAKSRKLRIDSLGDEAHRRAKASALDVLLRRSGRPGLAREIREQEPPRVRVMPIRAGTAAGACSGQSVVSARGKAMARWGEGRGAAGKRMAGGRRIGAADAPAPAPQAEGVQLDSADDDSDIDDEIIGRKGADDDGKDENKGEKDAKEGDDDDDDALLNLIG